MTRKWNGLFAVGVVVAAVVAAPTGTALAAAEQDVSTTPPEDTVTLITGDRVTVVGGKARISPGRGREGMHFATRTDERGDLHVVPADVSADVAAGRVDERLFDVSGLLANGYDDASSPVTPLIITRAGAGFDIAAAQDVQDAQALPSIDGYSVAADKSTPFLSSAPTARAAGARKIWLDGPVRAALDRSAAQIGAPEAWQAGHTGQGAKVAVLDTGIDATHPDLAGAVLESRNFSPTADTDDRNGHGTHVASTITGSGRYQGIAPDSVLLVGKVLDDYARGWESDIIAGMEWAANAGADVVNMSIASPLPTDGTDPMSMAVNRLTAETDTLFVVAAGNLGPNDQTITGPAAADASLAVGAVDRDEALAGFSSRGPRKGDGALKPDITAPGVDIVAARAKNSTPVRPVDDRYASISGTSMAAPHVAGAAAILAGLHPEWTADQLKGALMSSAKANPALSVYEQGAGRVDVSAAVREVVTAAPASLGHGVAAWPHQDDAPIVKTVAYTNSGTAPITLRVTADVRDSAGNAARAGLVTVSPEEITVAPGGKAAVTVTTDTALDAPDGMYSGVVVATGADSPVRVPIAFTKEVESHDVELSFIDHDGNPASNYDFRIVSLDQPKAVKPYHWSGTVVTRLAKAEYYVEGTINTWSEDGYRTTYFAEPAFAVAEKTKLVLDARQGKPVTFAVDRPSAKVGEAGVSFVRKTSWGDTGTGSGGDLDRLYWAPSTTSAPGGATFSATAKLAEPDGKGTFAGSPYQYHLSWQHDGGVPAEPGRIFADRDLAEVRASAATAAPGRSGFYDSMSGGPLPLLVTHFYSPGVPWDSAFFQVSGPDSTSSWETSQGTASPRVFGRGRSQTEKWNVAVFGPAFPKAETSYQWAYRTGDDVRINVPMFSDQDPTHYGHSKVDTAQTVLRRDGVVVGQSAQPGRLFASLPVAKGAYELEVRTARSGVSELSTSVSGTWRFTSERGSGSGPAALPLMAVRFAPTLDDHNRALAGRAFAIPVYAQRNGSATASGLGTPEIGVSYDDGASWAPARVVKVNGRWLAFVHHPVGATFVSLKARAQDADGNSVEQTIIRAYGLK